MKKILSLVLMAGLLTWGLADSAVNASANSLTGWKNISGHWYYYTSKGKATGWLLNGGKWYYLDSNGVMKTGWIYVNKKWYYLNSNGAMQTGWLYTGGKWYYLNPSGDMQTGWKTINGKQYYFYSSGAMAVSTIVDGKTIDSNGAVVQSKPSTPFNKAISDVQAFGATIKVQSSTAYEVYKNNKYIGTFGDGGVILLEQYSQLAETMALDLGFNATSAELKSLVDQAEHSTSSLFGNDIPFCYVVSTNAGPFLQIFWDPKSQFPSPSAQESKALNDIQLSGAVAKPGSNGCYNIFKNNQFIGSFNQYYVEVNSQFADLLEKVVFDLGSPYSLDQLKSMVQTTINTKKSVGNFRYDGTTLDYHSY